MNFVKLSGIISSDVIVNVTKSATPAVKFLLLEEQENYKNFINVTIFGNNVIDMNDKKKGDKVYIEGHIQQEKWFSKSLKKSLSRLVVVAHKVKNEIPS